jgi:cyclic pyranopterin phosphate synthase
MSDLPHFDEQGQARMVDVSEKPVTRRLARARGQVRMLPETLRRIRDRKLAKGDVLEIARIAAIMASKKTADLIPLCHPLRLDSVDISFRFPDDRSVEIETSVVGYDRTGVEMEAMFSVSVAALTIYDMCKSVDRGMTIGEIQLMEKSGGKRGHFTREAQATAESTQEEFGT